MSDIRLTEEEIRKAMGFKPLDEIYPRYRRLESAVLRKVAEFAASKCSNVDAIGPCCLNRFADTARAAAEEGE